MGVFAEADSMMSPSLKKPKLHHEPSVQIHIGGKVLERPCGTTVQDVLENEKVVAGRLDNEIVPLSLPIVGSRVQLEGVPLASSDGIRTLVETLKFLLKIAKNECEPNLAIVIGRPIGAAYVCELEDRVTRKRVVPTDEQLKKIQNQMNLFIESALPLRYMTVATQTAIDNLSKTGTGFTAKMLQDYNMAQVQVVECRGAYHLPRVPVLPNTAMIPKDSFNLTKFKDGFFLEHFRCDARSGEAKHWSQSAHASDMLYNEYRDRQEWARNVDLYSVSQLNSAIREGRSKQVIQAVEANCDRQFVELAAQVKTREDVKLLLIAGPSSSGKTTFAKRLEVQLQCSGIQTIVLSVDNFYKAWQDIAPEGAHKVDWESLDSLNLDQLNQVLVKLMAGEEALIPEYDMKTSMPMDAAHWKPIKLNPGGKGVVIMEGIHCLNPALTPSVPKTQKFNIAIAPIPALQLDGVHVLSGTTIRMLRRMVRDYLFRGRPVLTTLKQWPCIAAGEVNNIYPHQCNADAVMNSEIIYEMCVLKVHVEPLLKTIPPTEREYSEVRRLLQTLDQFIALPTNIIPPQSLLREFVGGSWYYDFGGWYQGH